MGLSTRLSSAQLAQAKGSPDALAVASSSLVFLEQCSHVLAQNCGNYADLFERVGWTIGDELETLTDALLDTLDRVQSFQDAVGRLRKAADERPPPGPSCRVRAEEGNNDSDID